jgi:hypothetical protein
MNFLFLFLSLIFSTVAPSTTSNGEGFTGNGTTTQEPGGGKKDKFENGDFIIQGDTNP